MPRNTTFQAERIVCQAQTLRQAVLHREVPKMDDTSWDKLFTTATLTIYQAEDVVRASATAAWSQAGAGRANPGSGWRDGRFRTCVRRCVAAL